MKRKIVSTTHPLRCNCVLYLRYLKYKFPFGMWNYWSKKRIINSHKPKAGAIAIIRAGYWGHLALVLGTRGDIKSGNYIVKILEANFPRCTVAIRWGNERELNIAGYYHNAKNINRHRKGLARKRK